MNTLNREEASRLTGQIDFLVEDACGRGIAFVCLVVDEAGGNLKILTNCEERQHMQDILLIGLHALKTD
jgi:hypothetical protein